MRIVEQAQADEICPASYSHSPEHHRWTSDTSDGITRCVKCAQRARFVEVTAEDFARIMRTLPGANGEHGG